MWPAPESWRRVAPDARPCGGNFLRMFGRQNLIAPQSLAPLPFRSPGIILGSEIARYWMRAVAPRTAPGAYGCRRASRSSPATGRAAALRGFLKGSVCSRPPTRRAAPSCSRDEQLLRPTGAFAADAKAAMSIQTFRLCTRSVPSLTIRNARPARSAPLLSRSLTLARPVPAASK
jgi:hypothetical protein